MSLFAKKKDINSGVEEFRSADQALLLDVREPDEYQRGHIPGAINVPLSTLQTEISKAVPEKNQLAYVYCQSGVRSKKATGILEAMGYDRIMNIGGFKDYKGDIEKEHL